MRKKVRHLLSAIAFIILTGLVVFQITKFFSLRSNMFIPEEYYEYDKDTFDVVFLGPSTIMYAANPTMLWEQYGIVSYNLGAPSQSMGSTYFLAQEVIDRDHPKALVVDVGALDYSSTIRSTEHLHYVTDTMPMTSLNKWKMIWKLDPNHLLQYVFPLDVYHTRWKELTKSDVVRSSRKEMLGAGISAVVATNEDVQNEPLDVTSSTEKWGMYYAEKLIQLCEKENVKLLFVTVPTVSVGDNGISQSTYTSRAGIYHDFSKVAEEYQIPYLNYFTLGSELDLATSDTKDGHHLNLWGAEKYSDFIGRYLSVMYEIPDRREDTSVAPMMNEAAEAVESYKQTYFIQHTSTLDRYFTFLAESSENNEYLILLTLNGTTNGNLPADIASSINKIGTKQSLKNYGNHSYLAVLNKSEVIYESDPRGLSLEEHYHAEINGLALEMQSSASSADRSYIKIDGAEYSEGGAGLSVVVYDQKQDQVIDSCTFTLNDGTYTGTHKDI